MNHFPGASESPGGDDSRFDHDLMWAFEVHETGSSVPCQMLSLIKEAQELQRRTKDIDFSIKCPRMY